MKRATRLVLAGMMALAIAGCTHFGQQDQQVQAAPPPTAQTAPTDISTYISKSAVREDGGETAVDAAIRWEQKYSDASDKLVKAQLENRQLQEEQAKLQEKVNKLSADLVAAQSQLKDANAMLMDVRNELERWKTSVLGFREEMRQAQQSQMVALAKVIKLLGGELMPSTAASQPVAAAAPEPAAPLKAVSNAKESPAHETH